MKRMQSVLAAIVFASLATGVAQAGGSASVTILSAPKDVVAGRAFEVAFAVRPIFPMARDRKIEPIVRAVCGDQVVTLAATPGKEKHQYQASIVLPNEGQWTITVDSRFCETRMKALTLKALPARVARS